MVKIAIDAGHGINTPGKRTPNGIREWTINNKVVNHIENELKKYDNVSILRVDDRTGKTDIPLRTRTNKANAEKVDFYLSIHHNANTSVWGNWGGAEVYVSAKTSSSNKKLAKELVDANAKIYNIRNRGVKTNNLHITRETKMPAILMELGFMDSTTDKVIHDENKQRELGTEIARIIAKHYNLKEKDVDSLHRVQVGAYRDISNAQKLVNDLEKLGYKPYIVSATEKVENKSSSTPTRSKEKTKAEKEKLAKDIANGSNGWKGVYGNARKTKVEKLGFNYKEIQSLVNKLV